MGKRHREGQGELATLQANARGEQGLGVRVTLSTGNDANGLPRPGGGAGLVELHRYLIGLHLAHGAGTPLGGVQHRKPIETTPGGWPRIPAGARTTLPGAVTRHVG